MTTSGVATRWNAKGFGFIKPDDGGEDVFCHSSSIKDGNSLPEGGKVEYRSVYDERKGKYYAEDVTGGITESPRRGGGRDRRGGRGRDRSRSRDRGRGGRDRSRSRERGGRDRRSSREIQRGTVALWKDSGFGFIRPSDGGKDLFVHTSGLTDGDMLRQGDKVEFRAVYDDRKGKYRAEEVTGARRERGGGRGRNRSRSRSRDRKRGRGGRDRSRSRSEEDNRRGGRSYSSSRSEASRDKRGRSSSDSRGKRSEDKRSRSDSRD